MKVRLIRDARINHKAGEIVEVSPDQMNFLVSVGSAVIAETATKKVEEVAERAVKIPKTTTAKKRQQRSEAFNCNPYNRLYAPQICGVPDCLNPEIG